MNTSFINQEICIMNTFKTVRKHAARWSTRPLYGAYITLAAMAIAPAFHPAHANESGGAPQPSGITCGDMAYLCCRHLPLNSRGYKACYAKNRNECLVSIQNSRNAPPTH